MMGEKNLLLTSNIESDWTFLMLGTTNPCAVAIATPMLWDPKQITNQCHEAWHLQYKM